MTPEQPLYVLAQAIVVSLFLGLIVWKLGLRDIVHWVSDDELRQGTRESFTFRFVAVTLIAAFPAGLLLGGIVEWLIERLMRLSAAKAQRKRQYDAAVAAADALTDPAARKDSESRTWANKPKAWDRPALWLLGALEARELLDAGNAWSKTWLGLRRHLGQSTQRFIFVRVRMKGGKEIVGGFGDKSWAAFDPHPTDLYIEQVFLPVDPDDPNGPHLPVQGGLGVFVAGSEIESVEFFDSQETAVTTT